MSSLVVAVLFQQTLASLGFGFPFSCRFSLLLATKRAWLLFFCCLFSWNFLFQALMPPSSLSLSAVIWNFTVIKQCVALAMLLFSVASWTLVFSSSIWFSLVLCEWITALGFIATTSGSLIPENVSFVLFEAWVFFFCFWFLFLSFLFSLQAFEGEISFAA